MNAIEKWHDVMKSGGKDAATKLDELLHSDVVFYSPVVFTPQKGKDITKLYLSAASGVFGEKEKTQGSEKQESKFKYVKEIINGNSACLEFETVQEAIQSYLSSINKVKISSCCIASAGTTHLDIFKPANNDWVINKVDVSSALNDVKVHWINDFSAQALATSTLSNDDLIEVNKGNPQADRVRLVIGPGTGLGTCGLTKLSSGWKTLPAQGGHSDFAPNSKLEIKILSILQKQFGHVAIERILSGPGIVNLYNVLCQINARDIVLKTPSEISSSAVSTNPDSMAMETLALFCRIFGSVTGSIALTTGCLGGIYITSDLVRNF